MPHRLFIHWNAYQAAKQELIDKLDALERTDPAQPETLNQALRAYNTFHRLTERNYPLLLWVGELVDTQVDKSASEQVGKSVYLLPKIPGMDARILVVQMPKTPGSLACLQLYAWQLSEPKTTDT